MEDASKSRLNELHAMVDELWIKYSNTGDDSEHMLDKLYCQVKMNLPATMQTHHALHKQREDRKKSLETISDEFIECFLNRTKYYYNACSELFFVYDDVKYAQINEDEIQHKILSEISALATNPDQLQQPTTLLPWKYRTKNQILKQIKERELLGSIPESRTIQTVIGTMFPALFETRDHAKYFITVIGDVIMKKNTLHYFVNPRAKEFMRELSQEASHLLGSSGLSSAFKFKFYEHAFEDSRLIRMQDAVSEFRILTSGKCKQHIVDLFCVAAHYSQRFGSADEFIRRHCKTMSVKTHAFFLKNNNEDQIIEMFVKHATEPSTNCSITWKNMIYLWKAFNEEHHLPSVFFNNALKTKLTQYCISHPECGGNYSFSLTPSGQPTNEVFLNMTSKHLPIVSKFIAFWNDEVHVNESEIEMDIDELSTLFNSYIPELSPNGGATSGDNPAPQLFVSDQIMLNLIRHFCPDIFIEDDKYLINVGCKLWEKKADVFMHLEEYQAACRENDCTAPQPLYNLYEHYCSKTYSLHKTAVSKRYFEKLFREYYGEHLNNDGLVKVSWWKQ